MPRCPLDTYRVSVSFSVPELSGSPAERYAELAGFASALIDGEPDRVANAANLSALVKATVPDLNWVGFYFFDGTELVVGPFQGLPACIRIPLDRGVCGAAARTGRTQRVDDVHAVADHIACDGATNSELVVPLVRDGELIGVFDLDSEKPARFTDDDQRGLEAIAAVYLDSLR
ncbi:Putative GAF sensor protein OS=Tsukamurella paurometabola (strain ATCC 8368 / DSM / CCUG 35730/ CIP 100753 / JCM 10117 / KCTC 9821 / NBRC 16120 / NCIMB 702349 / NCTC 13040) OX=521096 GN=Tpau_0178 PE=3 SV=1 [Tsukamurella paurometabola]|nr:Free methionine-R-sulfoxide reductase [Tsukamurella paurometabola]